ncbi:MAG: aspartate/glutamate racemase family protein [Gammaproteobacteria bacterium]|nr:aspartate/glutamate racemase family protein [Gammaproteobacteria bacterium]
MHVGMIGGIGPAATEFYYRNLIKAYKAANKKLELTIVHAEASDVINNIASKASGSQARLFLNMAQRLEKAGADVIVISSIAGHFCVSEFEALSPLPVINIIDALESEFTKKGLKKVGLLGHGVSMGSRLFGGISSTEIVVPLGDEFDSVSDEYIQMATTGKVCRRQRELFFLAGKNMCDKQGAELIVLAGTDLCLAFDGEECGFSVMDSALVHINAICNMEAKPSTNKATHATSA